MDFQRKVVEPRVMASLLNHLDNEKSKQENEEPGGSDPLQSMHTDLCNILETVRTLVQSDITEKLKAPPGLQEPP